MKQVIEGKTYNTETAKEIASYGNSLAMSDFRYFDETLFRTKKGAYFLSGEGGAMSKYSRPCGDMTGGGEGIIVLSVQEALEWCEQHDVGADRIEKEFEVEEA